MANETDSAPKAKRKAPAPRIIQCAECGTDVLSNSNNRKFCASCADARNLAKAKVSSTERYFANRVARTAKCAQCDAEFECRKGQNKYCCENCRRLATLDRLKDKRDASGVRVAGSPCSRCGAAMDSMHGGALYCAPCRKEVDREKGKRYRERNPEIVSDRERAFNAKRGKDPRYIEWRRAYSRERGRKTPRSKLDHRISQLVRNGLNGRKNGRTWESLVGYTIDDLYSHIERQFLPGMGWENIGEWHVDHILPRAMFNYETPECPDFKVCWAITNLRPLWADDNLKKSGARLHLI